MLLLLLACAKTTDSATPGTLTTDGGIYALELVATPEPFVAGELAALEITVTHAEERVDDATLTLSPWMPDMGHGLSEDPTVESQGEGVYAASWTFPMSGDWDIAIALDGGFGADSVTVTYAVQ